MDLGWPDSLRQRLIILSLQMGILRKLSCIHEFIKNKRVTLDSVGPVLQTTWLSVPNICLWRLWYLLPYINSDDLYDRNTSRCLHTVYSVFNLCLCNVGIHNRSFDIHVYGSFKIVCVNNAWFTKSYLRHFLTILLN